MNGPAGVFAARLVGAVTRSESELATIRFLPMAGKIATSKDWDPVRNALIALSGLVHVSNLLVVMATLTITQFVTGLFFDVIVDGSYNDWSAWTTCSMSCGGGVKFRHRNCTNPAPMHGGRDCSLIGPATESDSCHSEPCPGRRIGDVTDSSHRMLFVFVSVKFL